VLKSFPVKNFLVLENQDFQNCLNGIKAKNDDIRLSVRRSGTERKIRIRIEGDDDNNINKIMHKLENFLV
jgi:phosphomannomutase